MNIIEQAHHQIDPSWIEVLGRELDEDYLADLGDYLSQLQALNKVIYPPTEMIFAAFEHTNFDNLKVVILGQDPYHGDGQANGLCFSVARGNKIPPSLRNAIMGIDRYTSTDFVNGKGVETGKIGNLYGVDIFVSTNVPVIDTTGGASIRGAQLIHKDTSVLAEQQAVRSQTQYKQEFLGTLYTADTLYGVQVMRPEAGFTLAVV